jgi:hypothetical protein
MSLNGAGIPDAFDYVPPSCHSICVYKAYFLIYFSALTLVPSDDSAGNLRASPGEELWDGHGSCVLAD